MSVEKQTIKGENGIHQEKILPVPIKMYNLFEGAKKGFNDFFELFKELQAQDYEKSK